MCRPRRSTGCRACSSLLPVRYQVVELPPVGLVRTVQGAPAAVGEVLAGLHRLVLDLGRVVVRYALPADEQDRAGREHDLSQLGVSVGLAGDGEQVIKGHAGLIACGNLVFAVARIGLAPVALNAHTGSSRSSCRVQDRKSTRLNSSHLGISYAVFCLT